MEDNIKKALLDGTATIQTKIEIITDDEENIILDEQNSVVSWDYEDFRYVKDDGWIGQFVARQVNGVVKNISDDFSMTDKEFVLHMGVKIGDNTTWYNLGNFLVNKVTDDEVNDKTSFEALDYTKKFNQTYVDSIAYPCTALELAQNVCEQCGCELGNTDFKHNDWEITGNAFTNGESCREVLKAIGKLAYSWVRVDWDNKVYIDFKSPFRNLFDKDNANLLTAIINGDTKVIASYDNCKTLYIPCLHNKTYTISRRAGTRFIVGTTTDLPVINTTCNQIVGNNTASSLTITTTDIDNYLLVFYYYYDSDTLTEEEIRNSIIIKEQSDEYNKINNSNYYSLTTQKEKIGAINRVVIGYKDIEGERTKVEDKEDIETNGVNEITVYDNPLVYSQELREKAIVGAEDLFGLEYLPLETLTVGHPWLKGDELVEVTNMEGKIHKTIPFDRTIQYFGHIKTKINVATNTKTNTEYAYGSGIGGRFRKTEIMVDKINGQITEVIEEQTETTKKLNETISTVDQTKQTISSVETTVENITTTTQTSTGGNTLNVKEVLESNALQYHVDGKSEQETSVQGKNYFTGNKLVSGTKLGITYSFDNSIIKLNGTTTNMGTFYEGSTKIKLPAGTYSYTLGLKSGSFTTNGNDLAIYLMSDTNFITGSYSTSGHTLQAIENSTNNRSTRSFTIDEDVELYVRLYANGTGIICEDVELELQLEPGLVSTDFEQFTPNSPSPDYPSEIKTIPSIRNLFDIGTSINDYFATDNNGTRVNKTVNISDYVSINIDDNSIISTNYNNSGYRWISKQVYLNKNTNYIITGDVNRPVKILGFSSLEDNTEGTELSYLDNQNLKPPRIFNSGDYAYHVISMYPPKDAYFKNIMLEEDSVAHDHVPYGTWAKVKVTGKNIVNYNKTSTDWEGASITTDGNTIIYTPSADNTGAMGHNSSHKTIFIPKGTTLTWSQRYISGEQWEKGSLTNTLRLVHKDGTYEQYNLYDFLPTNYQTTKSTTFTTEQDVVEIYSSCLMYGVAGLTTPVVMEYQLEYGTEVTEYETYKEKEVLIDLNKPNLFDKDNVINGYYLTNEGVETVSTYWCVSDYIEVVENANYTYQGITSPGSAPYSCYYDKDKNFISSFHQTTGTNIITTPKNACYVRFSINTSVSDENKFVLFEGYTDYYELSSIGDIKDTLNIVNGQVTIEKKIGKVVLNGSETWYNNSIGDYQRFIIYNLPNIYVYTDKNRHDDKLLSSHFNPNKTDNYGICYRFENGVLFYSTKDIITLEQWKNWLNENPTTVYYDLAKPQQIVLSNNQIPLHEGINNIILTDDLQTTTSIKFLRKTPISGEYALNQDLDITNNNLANTDSKTNENTSNINATNTNLNNNYYTKPQIDIMNSSTTEEITTIKKEVETKITAEDLTIAINQIKTTGATSVETSTGYTFDEEGLKIQKSGSEMSSLLDNDGLVVKRNETEMLTVRSSGVEAENITVRTYFTIGDNTRAENYKGGTGFFYIGGDN